MIGEELHPVNGSRHAAGASQLPDRADRLVDQRRTYRAALDGEQLMRVVTEVTQRERRITLQPDTSAVAVIPGFRRVQLDFEIKFQLGGPAQRLTQDLRLKSKLGRVINVLVLAAAAATEVWALRRDAVGGRCQDR